MNKPTLAEIFAAPPQRPTITTFFAINLIDIPENRLRPANPHMAAAMAEQIRAGKKLPPIELRPGTPGRFWLVVGGHRLEGHKLAGHTEIAASVEDMTEHEARLREIDENLFRQELTTIDRSLSLAERDRMLREQHPESGRGGDRKSRERQEKIKAQGLHFDLSAEVAAKVGLSKRSIQQAIALARALSPEAVTLLRETYLADHGADLQQLARLRPDQQVVAVRAIAEGQSKSLKEALVALGRGPAPIDEQERLYQAFAAALPRMSARTRKRVRDLLHKAGEA